LVSERIGLVTVSGMAITRAPAGETLTRIRVVGAAEVLKQHLGVLLRLLDRFRSTPVPSWTRSLDRNSRR